jgi:hypothetical protein
MATATDNERSVCAPWFMAISIVPQTNVERES